MISYRYIKGLIVIFIFLFVIVLISQENKYKVFAQCSTCGGTFDTDCNTHCGINANCCPSAASCGFACTCGDACTLQGHGSCTSASWWFNGTNTSYCRNYCSDNAYVDGGSCNAACSLCSTPPPPPPPAVTTYPVLGFIWRDLDSDGVTDSRAENFGPSSSTCAGITGGITMDAKKGSQSTYTNVTWACYDPDGSGSLQSYPRYTTLLVDTGSNVNVRITSLPSHYPCSLVTWDSYVCTNTQCTTRNSASGSSCNATVSGITSYGNFLNYEITYNGPPSGTLNVTSLGDLSRILTASSTTYSVVPAATYTVNGTVTSGGENDLGTGSLVKLRYANNTDLAILNTYPGPGGTGAATLPLSSSIPIRTGPQSVIIEGGDSYAHDCTGNTTVPGGSWACDRDGETVVDDDRIALWGDVAPTCSTVGDNNWPASPTTYDTPDKIYPLSMNIIDSYGFYATAVDGPTYNLDSVITGTGTVCPSSSFWSSPKIGTVRVTASSPTTTYNTMYVDYTDGSNGSWQGASGGAGQTLTQTAPKAYDFLVAGGSHSLGGDWMRTADIRFGTNNSATNYTEISRIDFYKTTTATPPAYPSYGAPDLTIYPGQNVYPERFTFYDRYSTDPVLYSLTYTGGSRDGLQNDFSRILSPENPGAVYFPGAGGTGSVRMINPQSALRTPMMWLSPSTTTSCTLTVTPNSTAPWLNGSACPALVMNPSQGQVSGQIFKVNPGTASGGSCVSASSMTTNSVTARLYNDAAAVGAAANVNWSGGIGSYTIPNLWKSTLFNKLCINGSMVEGTKTYQLECVNTTGLTCTTSLSENCAISCTPTNALLTVNPTINLGYVPIGNQYWYTLLDGDVYAPGGISGVIPVAPLNNFAPSFINTQVNSPSTIGGYAFSDGPINLALSDNQISEAGGAAYNLYDPSSNQHTDPWLENFKHLNYEEPPPSNATDYVSGNTFTNGQVYFATFAEINSLIQGGTYSISGIPAGQYGAAIVYVTGAGTININNNFVNSVDPSHQTLLLIANQFISFVIDPALRVPDINTYSPTTPSQIDLSIITASDILYRSIKVSNPAADDNPLVVNGITVSRKEVNPQRDLGVINNGKYPATTFRTFPHLVNILFNYDKLNQTLFNYTGLAKFDLQFVYPD